MSRHRKNHCVYDASRITLKGDFCIYCGEVSTTSEHYPPAATTYRGFKLPCCFECNVLASDENARNFERRIESVKSKIRRKNWKWLQIPEWSHEELDDLMPALRRDVIYSLNKKYRTNKRLEFDSLVYLALIDVNQDFAEFFDESEVA